LGGEASSLDQLLKQRDELKHELIEIGDMRPGSLTERYLKCGKPGCHCNEPGAQGHGPYWHLTFDQNGKTVTKSIPAGSALEDTKKQISEFKHFREICRHLVDVNQKICDNKLLEHRADTEVTAKEGASKKGSIQKSRKNSSPS